MVKELSASKVEELENSIFFNSILFLQHPINKDYYVSKCGKVLSNKLYLKRNLIILKMNVSRGYFCVPICSNSIEKECMYID